MKKLVHLGIVAIFAITVSSCSKSTNDLVLQQESKSLPGQVMYPGPAEVNTVEGETTIFPYITEPFKVRMGDPGCYLAPGVVTVLYVALSGSFTNAPASSATLTTIDDNTGLNIQSYILISSDEASAYGILVPADLVGQPFMFAIVELDDQYSGKTITIQSAISVDESFSAAQLDHAFTVSY